MSCAIAPYTARHPRLATTLRVMRGIRTKHDQQTISFNPSEAWGHAGGIGGDIRLPWGDGHQSVRAGSQPKAGAASTGDVDDGIRRRLPAEELAEVSSATLTQGRLKEVLHYDPETGLFTWLVERFRVHAGDRAGCTKAGYVYIGVDGIKHAAHRLAFLYMTGTVPDLYIDHINSNGTDNRWCNLRVASNSENQRNVSLKATNTSGYKGVSWHKTSRRWRADIRVGGKKKSLGTFRTPEDAYGAYCLAAKKYHGEFARLNS